MSERSPSAMRALIRLLGDEDERTASIARAKLIESGEPALPYLMETVRDPDARIRARSRLLIEQIRLDLLKERFRRYAALPERQLDLETGVFLIASYGYPEVAMAPYRRTLDRLAEAVREDLHRDTEIPYPDPADRALPRELAALKHRLFRVEGFRGNEGAYYDPDNSYLNRVLDRRLGIPITLAAVVLLVGERLGLPVYGIPLPGHFVVGYDPHLAGGTGAMGVPTLRDPTRAIWLDPFHGGELLSLEDCYRLMRRFGQTPDPAYLHPAPVRLIVVRMLLNLINIYGHTNRVSQGEELSELVRIMAHQEGDLDPMEFPEDE